VLSLYALGSAYGLNAQSIDIHEQAQIFFGGVVGHFEHSSLIQSGKGWDHASTQI